MNEYQYILSLNDGTPTAVTPIIDDGQTFEHEKEAEQVFLRKKLAGSELLFCNQDFDVINNAPFTTKFTIDKAIRTETGDYESQFTGIFYKTDCKVDRSRRQITVQPEPHDKYKPVLEGLDREFDLIDLAPELTELDYFTQPVFQIYEIETGDGRNALTNIYGGIQFEQDVTEPVNYAGNLEDYHFGFLGGFGVLSSESLNPTIPLEYVFAESSQDYGKWVSRDGTTKIELTTSGSSFQWLIRDNGTNATIYTGTLNTTLINAVFTSTSSASTCTFSGSNFYGRLITGLEEIDGTPTLELPEDDIVTTSVNYTHALPIGIDILPFGTGTYGTIWEDSIIASSGNSETATKYGKFTDGFFAGKYFVDPVGNGNIHPLQRSLWTDASYWFQYNDTLLGLQESGAKKRTQYHAYELKNVLQSLLTALNTNLIFDETCSQFLFDDDNPIRTITATPVIIPKSNIIVGEYNDPAKKAPIKLSDVFAFLWGTYKCKWHIEGERLIVEHIEYYHKGKSYGAENIGADITELIEGKTGQPWTYLSDQWEYDKTQIPGQIRFSWMDDSSAVFDGYPIEIRSGFADQGTIEDVPISVFTADVDYIQLAPDSISKDGFFFGEAATIDGRLVLPFVSLEVGNTGSYKAQNGYASMLYLHDQYHRYVLPADEVIINLEDVTAESVKRTRIQTIELPSGAVNEGNIMNLINTNLGAGLIRSLSDHTNGGGAELVIEHDLS